MADILDDLASLTADIEDLHILPGNPRRGDIAAVARSLEKFGQRKPVVARRSDGTIIAGNHTMLAARKLGWDKLAVVWVDDDDATAKAFALADNRTAELGGYDETDLAAMLAEVQDVDPGLLTAAGWSGADLEALLGQLDDQFGTGSGGAPPRMAINLAERFGVPPFTVLDTRKGYWQDRKKSWLALGIRSEEGRGEDPSATPHANHAGAMDMSVHKRDINYYDKKRKAEAKIGRELTNEEFLRDHYASKAPSGVVFHGMQRRDPSYYQKKKVVEQRLGREISTAEFDRDHYPGMSETSAIASGTSIFDPVLCEVVYRWYCPSGGTVIDPFAGGSVRGVVAAALGRRYYGGELRAEQVAANRSQWVEIAPLLDTAPWPLWVEGDSRSLRANLGDDRPDDVDLLFTCPPYADLEVYSDDPADLSNMPYDQFLLGYRDCLAEPMALLADDSFAVLVVGEVRSKKGDGAYYGFVPDTISTMESLGARYYGEHVLVNMVGSAAMAASRQFMATRKAARVHQTVLVFVKGDARRAAERSGIDPTVDLPDPDLADVVDHEEDQMSI